MEHKKLSEYPDTPFDVETIEELSGYTVRDVVACYQDYERAMAENEALIEIVKKLDLLCEYCWYKGKEAVPCDSNCSSCKKDCVCKDCQDDSKWAWKDAVNLVYYK